MKKHQIVFLTIFLYTLNTKLIAQSQNWITNNQLTYEVLSNFNTEGAIKDIKKKNIRILFLGGFGRIPVFNNKKDVSFQKKYSVKFFSQGCIRMGNNENEEAYNQTIFKYLDKKFGKHWRNEIRKDPIGFK